MIESFRDKIHNYKSKFIGSETKENPVIEFFLDNLLKPMNTYLSLKKDICNFFYWGWNLRDDRDYDHYFLEHILYLKVSRMYEYMKDSNRARWANMDRNDPEYSTDEAKPFKALRIAYKILHRIENNSYDRYEKNIRKLYGSLKMETFPFEDDPNYLRIVVKRENETDENSEEIVRLSKYYRDLDRSVRERDRRILFRLMHLQGESWWD